MSYYRKYRPQTVADLDQEVVKKYLTAVLETGNYAHAYLLTGPKGTGKTSSARILAKILNCDKNTDKVVRRSGFSHQSRFAQHNTATEGKVKDKLDKKLEVLNEPCGECRSCLDITSGVSMCVVELDAASNRGIDDVRQLQERVGLAPSGGVRSVFIIDEVHMLTSEAFNALLKTLEEPPTHVVFALCTTEAQKVPATVMSRCTQIALQKPTNDEIRSCLNKAIKGEGLNVDDDAMDLIAKRSEGSFRDALKILEQAAAFGDQITTALVNDATQYAGMYDSTAFVEVLMAKDAKQAITILGQKEQAGIDFGVFGARVVERLRETFIKKLLENDSVAENIGKLLEKLQNAVPLIKYSPVAQLPLELVVAEWCGTGRGESTVEIKKLRRNGKNGEDRLDELDESQDLVEKRKEILPDGPDLTPGAIKPGMSITTIAAESEGIEGAELATKPSLLSLEVVTGKWGDMLKQVKPKNHSLEALLKAARPTVVDNGWLTIEVFYNFHKEQLEQERHKRIVETVLEGLCGERVKLKFALGKRARKALEETKAAVTNVTGSVEDEELAKAAEEIFGGS